jgi:hypothetical protein
LQISDSVSFSFAPKPLDWRKTYAKSDKIPYGNYVLFNQLEGIFGEKNIEATNITAYELEESKKLYEFSSLFYIQEKFSPSELELEVLMDWVKMGNQVFVASNSFGGTFVDTFQLEQDFSGGVAFEREEDENGNELEARAVSFTNPNLDIEADYFYLNSTPLAFTNYNILLESNHKYVSSALSYLPKKPILWDEYYKVGRSGPKTPLRFVLANPPLKWAWFTAIATILVSFYSILSENNELFLL